MMPHRPGSKNQLMPTSSGRPPADSSRPYQNCTTAEQYQWLLMFRHIPSVYSIEPVPNVSSGQRFGPSRRSKSTCMPSLARYTLVIFAVSGQKPRAAGDPRIVACFMSNGTYLNEPTLEYGPSAPLDGSETRTRQ